MKVEILVPPFKLLPIVPYLPLITNKEGMMKTYPITLYARKNGEIDYIGFAFAYFFKDKAKNTGLRIDYLASFHPNKRHVFNVLLREIEELAFDGGASYIEAEVPFTICEKIPFPSTSSVCSGYCDPDAIRVLKKAEFKELSRRTCLYYDISKNHHSGHSKLIDEFSIQSVNEKGIITKLLPESLCHPDFHITVRKGDKRILEAAWLPNLYTILRRLGGLPIASFSFKRVDEAKIFYLKMHSKEITSSLFHVITSYFERKYNLAKLYVGNLDCKKNKNIINKIEEAGWNEAYRTVLLRK